jgi:two-component system chemotaxis response regulator CheY
MPRDSQHADGTRPKRCLVVDDSPLLRKLVCRMLVDLSMAVEEAGNGAEALAMCERAMPDAILLDWNMPVMSGIEFVKQLRTMVGGGTPVVVFCTTERKLSQIEEAIAAGADEYIMKPFDIEILKAKLAQEGLL